MPGQDLSLGERRLWNDTITPAERAAREPSGMSCLSKALSAPPRAPPPPGAAVLPGLTWAACGDPRRSVDGDGSSLDPTVSGDTRSECAPSPCWCVPPRLAGQGSRAAPALRTVSSWSGVSSDSQITSWLWVAQGAPHRGTALPCQGGTQLPPQAGAHVPTPAPGLWVRNGCGLQPWGVQSCLRSPKTSC